MSAPGGCTGWFDLHVERDVSLYSRGRRRVRRSAPATAELNACEKIQPRLQNFHQHSAGLVSFLKIGHLESTQVFPVSVITFKGLWAGYPTIRTRLNNEIQKYNHFACSLRRYPPLGAATVVHV